MSNTTDPDISYIIEMAWDDETSFDAIKAQTGLLEKDIIALMRREMKPPSFRIWRKRVTGRKSKHAQKIESKNKNLAKNLIRVRTLGLARSCKSDSDSLIKRKR